MARQGLRSAPHRALASSGGGAYLCNRSPSRGRVLPGAAQRRRTAAPRARRPEQPGKQGGTSAGIFQKSIKCDQRSKK